MFLVDPSEFMYKMWLTESVEERRRMATYFISACNRFNHVIEEAAEIEDKDERYKYIESLGDKLGYEKWSVQHASE